MRFYFFNHKTKMFTKKNDPIQNLNQNSYVHTMNDDLKNPLPQKEVLQTEQNHVEKNSLQNNFQEKNFSKSGSPFFSENPAPSPFESTQKINELSSQEKFSKSQSLPNSPLQTTSNSTPEMKESFVANENIQTNPSKKSTSLGITITILILIIVGIIAAGAYFFIMTKQSSIETGEINSSTEKKVSASNSQADDQTININSVLEKYSTKNPNIISIDINNASDQEIRELFNIKALEVAKMQVKEPVEFVITDNNNAPIAFPIFALAAKINLSQDILANLEEKFSIYIYPENSISRLGLAVKLKNKELVLTKMLAEEKTLPQDVAFLFLDSKPEFTKDLLFKDGKYNNLSVRYLNLNSSSSLSIDYALTNDSLLIGTSKNTLRTIIDKLSPQTITTEPVTQTEPGTIILNQEP